MKIVCISLNGYKDLKTRMNPLLLNPLDENCKSLTIHIQDIIIDKINEMCNNQSLFICMCVDECIEELEDKGVLFAWGSELVRYALLEKFRENNWFEDVKKYVYEVYEREESPIITHLTLKSGKEIDLSKLVPMEDYNG